jgi:hypothetical protein
MAILQLPIVQEMNNYQFRTDLNNETFLFYFYWNSRAAYWTMNIYTDAGDDIITNVPLLLNVDLLANYRHLAVPKGQLFIINVTSANAEATFENFGIDVLLMYKEAE